MGLAGSGIQSVGSYSRSNRVPSQAKCHPRWAPDSAVRYLRMPSAAMKYGNQVPTRSVVPFQVNSPSAPTGKCERQIAQNVPL